MGFVRMNPFVYRIVITDQIIIKEIEYKSMCKMGFVRNILWSAVLYKPEKEDQASLKRQTPNYHPSSSSTNTTLSFILLLIHLW